jgi:hypothetical protein
MELSKHVEQSEPSEYMEPSEPKELSEDMEPMEPGEPSEHMEPSEPSDSSEPKELSRREFVTAFGAFGAAILAIGGTTTLAACADDEAPEEDEEAFTPTPTGEEPNTLRVSEDQVLKAIDFEERPLADYMYEVGRFDLPFGTVVHQINDWLALTLTTHSEGAALVDINLLNLGNGHTLRLFDHAVGGDFGHPDAIIYNARASDSLIVWTECDIASLQWQVYMAPLSTSEDGSFGSYSVGSPTQLDSGEPDYEVPQLAVEANKVYWTVMPNPSGPANYEDSLLKAAVYGSKSPYVVFTSHGRMITHPLITQGYLTFSPRVDTTNIYYQLTAMDITTDKLVKGVVLPQSVRALDAIFLGEHLSFSIENNYSYAGGIGLYGTYLQLPSQSTTATDRWLHLYRKPSAPPVLLAGHLVVKSATRVILIDTEAQTYCSIAPLADCADYGDILAGWGARDRLAIYTNVRSTSALSQARGILRVFQAVEKPS